MSEVKKKHEHCCQCKAVSEGQCGLVPPAEPRFILRGKAYQDQHTFTDPLCDYLVFWKDDRIGYSIAIVELKGGNVSRNSATQLVNGGTLADALASVKITAFAAILAINKSPHPEDRKVLSKAKVRFQGVDYPIRTVRCGSKILDVLPWKR